jgi:CheY-like chemotaxis protein
MGESQKKILIVDDDQFLRDMVAAAFRKGGFEVTEDPDGQAAWERVAGGYRPDVVLTGILMPRMTGFDLIRKMQEDTALAAIPVAVFSHRGRDEDRKTAQDLNADEFIVQGIVPLAEVVRRVKNIAGEAPTYRIYLKRFHDDAEELVQTLDVQQHTEFGTMKNETFFLELTPLTEPGHFTVRLTKGQVPLIES